MPTIIPFIITTIHDPGGRTRRGAVANLEELVSTASRSPAAIYKAVEERYLRLVDRLRPIISKERLENEDRATIGELVRKFEEEMRNYSTDLGLEVINLPQALAEDLKKDVNTIQAYLIYSKARRENPNLPKGLPRDIVVETLRANAKPMTPRQISVASGANYNTVRREVQELLRDGKIVKTSRRGMYMIRQTQ